MGVYGAVPDRLSLFHAVPVPAEPSSEAEPHVAGKTGRLDDLYALGGHHVDGRAVVASHVLRALARYPDDAGDGRHLGGRVFLEFRAGAVVPAGRSAVGHRPRGIARAARALEPYSDSELGALNWDISQTV